MHENEDAGAFVTAVFRAWRSSGVRFLVLRNYEGLPRFTTNDIDVLVEKNQRGQAEKILLATAGSSGFRLLNRAEFATLALYFSHQNSGAAVHFDLFAALQWRGFDFLHPGELLEKRLPRGDFFIPCPAHEAAVNLVASFVFNGRVKEKYRAGIAATFRAEPEAARALLAGTFGPGLAGEFVRLGAQEDWRIIESKAGAARRALVLGQALGNPLKTFLSLDADCDRLLKRAFSTGTRGCILRPGWQRQVHRCPEGGGKPPRNIQPG
jgi:hypothetical protein